MYENDKFIKFPEAQERNLPPIHPPRFWTQKFEDLRQTVTQILLNGSWFHASFQNS